MEAWLRTWFRRSPNSFTNVLFLAMAVVWAVATAGAALRDWSWPAVVLFGAGLAAVLLIAADELITLLGRPRPMADRELRGTLVDWLRRQGYDVQEQPVDGGFRLRAEAAAGQHHPLTVWRTGGEPRIVRVATGLAIPAALREQFARMPADERAEAIEDMRMEMARLGVTHRGIGVPLVAIEVEDGLLADEMLTEQAFFQGVRRAVIAATVLRQQLNRAFRRAQGSTAGEVDALIEAVSPDTQDGRGEMVGPKDPLSASGGLIGMT